VYKNQELKVPSGENAGPIVLKLWKLITDIQYGKVENHPWSVKI
jgi:hypothetical protein